MTTLYEDEALFLAHSVALEQEAAQRLYELANTMDVHNNRELQGLLLELAAYSEHHAGDGDTVFATAEKFGLEGIVSKRADSPYRAGRGDDWRKIKRENSDEFVIVGYTEPKGSRHGFGALLLAEQRGEAAAACADGGVHMLAQMPAAVHVC